MNKKLFWILGAIIIWFVCAICLPLKFMATIALILAIPFLILFDFAFYLLPIVISLLIILVLYTLISRNYQKFNRVCFFLLLIVLIGFGGIRIDLLFRSTNYFGVLEFLYLYLILFVILALTALLIYILQKRNTKYYIIPISIFILYLVCEFISFYGI